VGAPTELLDESGGIAWRTRSTLWGTTTWNADATAYTPLRFPGQYADPETGLHYNFHRHYDPTTARYLSQDPLGLDPSPNPVTYVHNPHTWADPLGLAGTGTGAPLNLGEGYRGRLDQINEGPRCTDFEIHVYLSEVGKSVYSEARGSSISMEPELLTSSSPRE
jgi:RHS repeat-associated protein